MTLSSASARMGALAGAIATSVVLLFAAPQAHAASGRYYSVELSQPVEAKKAVVRGVVFQCEGTTCRCRGIDPHPRHT